MSNFNKNSNENVPPTVLKFERVQNTGSYLNFHLSGVLLSKDFVKKEKNSFYKLFVLLPFSSKDGFQYPSYIDLEENIELEIAAELESDSFPSARAKFDCILSKGVLGRLLEAKQVVIISVYGKAKAAFFEKVPVLEVVHFRFVNVKKDNLHPGWWIWRLHDATSLGLCCTMVDLESELGKLSR